MKSKTNSCPKDDCDGKMIEETISRREAVVRRVCLTCGYEEGLFIKVGEENE